jgi:hypothetical protein
MEMLSRRESLRRALVLSGTSPVTRRTEMQVQVPYVHDPLIGDPEGWEDELHQWATARCVFCDRALGGMAALHRDYVEWSHATGNIPPATLATFQAWIAWQRFTLTDPLVHGLLLAEDFKFLLTCVTRLCDAAN